MYLVYVVLSNLLSHVPNKDYKLLIEKIADRKSEYYVYGELIKEEK